MLMICLHILVMFADYTTVLSFGASHRSIAIDMQSILDKIYEYAVNDRLVLHSKHGRRRTLNLVGLETSCKLSAQIPIFLSENLPE